MSRAQARRQPDVPHRAHRRTRSEEGTIPVELKSAAWRREHECVSDVLATLSIDLSGAGGRSLLQQSLAEPEQRVFVVMKFGDRVLDSAYEGVMKPIGEEFGFEVT